MKFTPTEIKLCQDITKYWRKEIKSGDYILDKEGNACLVIRSYLKHGFIVIDQDESLSLDHSRVSTPIDKHTIPLLTLEDCLEFLRKRGWNVIQILRKIKKTNYYVHIICEEKIVDNLKEYVKQFTGKTPLEACLRAVLTILEEK